MTPEDFDRACESVAHRVLVADGSGLQHYMPATKDNILKSIRASLQDIYRQGFKHGLDTQKPLAIK